MQDVFEEGSEAIQPGETQPTEQQPQGAEQGQQQPVQGAEQQPTEGQGAASPAATEQGKHVPLEALEAERKGRQDWKEKAIRAEAERDQLRQQMERAQNPQQQPQQLDPLQQMQQQFVNERFNTSEMLVREKYADVDDVVSTFKEAAAKNPALAAQMHQHPHPWKFAYEEGKRLRFAAEIGNDPEAYRKKLRAEIEAEMRGQGASNPAQSAASATASTAIPQSLAGARSAGGRGDTYTGPTPFEDLFPN